jgi:(2Fe-2S) ferredoxin
MGDRGMNRRVLVCQNRTCLKQGAAKVWAELEAATVPDVAIEKSGCLGQCGNGPMVLVLPEEIWYDRVQLIEVKAIAERHLRQGQPVRGMLYRKFHS